MEHYAIEQGEYQVLSEEDLKAWHTQIVELKACPLFTPLKALFAYYEYLEKNNHFYGNIALQRIPNLDHFAARLSHQYLYKLAGKEVSVKERREVLLALTLADIQYRLQNKGEPISPHELKVYHYAVFYAQWRTKESEWCDTIFHKSPEIGFGFIGHMGHLRRAILDKFNMPARIGRFLIDVTIRETMLSLPLCKSLSFLEDMLSELDKTPVQVCDKSLLTLGMERWVRSILKNCFDLIHGAAINGFTIINRSLEKDITRYFTQSEPPKWEGNTYYPQLIKLCFKLVKSTILFKKYVPNINLDLERQAHIVYMKNYQSRLPEVIEDFIEECIESITSCSTIKDSRHSGAFLDDEFNAHVDILGQKLDHHDISPTLLFFKAYAKPVSKHHMSSSISHSC
jgi:hypothetical protein